MFKSIRGNDIVRDGVEENGECNGGTKKVQRELKCWEAGKVRALQRYNVGTVDAHRARAQHSRHQLALLPGVGLT